MKKLIIGNIIGYIIGYTIVNVCLWLIKNFKI